MVEGISQALRRDVATRAGVRCEYSLLPMWALLAGGEVDHVISRKHDGRTESSNLALSCARCNRAKGSDIGSLDPATSHFSRLFNPRTDRWEEHFALDGARLVSSTPVGRVTLTLLHLNDTDRMIERALLQQIGEYPRGKSRQLPP